MNTLRRLALGFASALALTPAFAGAARAGDVTYPQLTTATTVVDTDVLATWRGAGPLTRINASTLAAYLQGKFNSDYLQISNNLSDLTNLTAARSSLGLGSAALQSTGASGANVCLMNANCTWSGTESFQASVTFGLTTTFTGVATFNGGLSGALTGNVNGNVSGNAGTASQWLTTRTENLTGDVTGSASVNGAGNWSIGTTLAASGVGAGTYGSGDGQHYPVIQFDAKGRAVGAYNQAINFPNPTASQLFSILGLASSGGGQIGSVTIPTANGNVIINWGWFSAMGGGGNNTTTFTTSYTSSAIGIATGSSNACAANVISNSQITIHNDSGGVQNCYWLSIGT